jgi:predicted KAP-like P-loop ATPase
VTRKLYSRTSRRSLRHYSNSGTSSSDDDADAFAGPEGNSARISSVLYFLLPKIDQTQRLTALSEGLRNAASSSTAVTQLHRLRQRDENPEPGEAELLDAQASSELLEIALERIREEAVTFQLLDRRELFFILYRWKAWNGEDEPRTWVGRVIEGDDRVLQLLERARQGAGINLRVLADFCDLSALASRVEDVSDVRDVSEAEATTLRVFRAGLELHEKGLDTSDWLTWDRNERGH